MPLIEERSKMGYVTLLENKNEAFASILAIIFKLKTQHPNHALQSI
jgi:hypothetical protein